MKFVIGYASLLSEISMKQAFSKCEGKLLKLKTFLAMHDALIHTEHCQLIKA